MALSISFRGNYTFAFIMDEIFKGVAEIVERNSKISTRRYITRRHLFNKNKSLENTDGSEVMVRQE